MKNKVESPVVSALKEMARVALIAVVPLLISSLEAGLIDYREVAIVALIAVLRAVDKYLHKSGSERGLTGF